MPSDAGMTVALSASSLSPRLWHRSIGGGPAKKCPRLHASNETILSLDTAAGGEDTIQDKSWRKLKNMSA